MKFGCEAGHSGIFGHHPGKKCHHPGIIGSKRFWKGYSRRRYETRISAKNTKSIKHNRQIRLGDDLPVVRGNL